jgi:adenylosuccinate lyase
MISEQLIVEAVENGIERDKAHELIRQVTVLLNNNDDYQNAKNSEIRLEMFYNHLVQYNNNSFGFMTIEKFKEIANPLKLLGNCKNMIINFIDYITNNENYKKYNILSNNLINPIHLFEI